MFEPGATATDEVLFAREAGLGRILLNRPKAINALTLDMIEALKVQLNLWADDERISVVSVQGAGDRGLCAGGDVRRIRDGLLNGTADAAHFWRAEYAVNEQIATYPKPIVAIMDGVTMGGGLGISAHASTRLATERSRIAMPETAIGFFPDVGMSYLLARAPGESGTHLAMTGAPVSGHEAVRAGLADTVIDSQQITEVIDRLVSGQPPEQVADGPAETGDVPEWITRCYGGDDPVAILGALTDDADPEARQAAQVIASRSPLSVAVTLEALRRARTMSLEQVLAQDLRLGAAFSRHPDFIEGVRAVLVDKDHRPQWQHGALSDVTRAEVLAMFE